MRYCSIASGSSGNCHFVEGGGVRVLVDAGLSMRALEENLRSRQVDPASIRAIFVTHEHSDHIRALGAWSRKYRIPVFASTGTWEALHACSVLGKMDPQRCYAIRDGKGYRLGALRVEGIRTYHDAREPMAYVFSAEEDTHQVTVMTDTGIVTEEMTEKILHSDIAALESNHDVQMLMNGPYPYLLKKRIRSNLGHLSNEDCGKLACRLFQENPSCRILLSHLSEENNTPATALETVCSIVRQQFPESLDSGCIDVAPRFEPSVMYESGPDAEK